jgi:hypothetical protein
MTNARLSAALQMIKQRESNGHGTPSPMRQDKSRRALGLISSRGGFIMIGGGAIVLFLWQKSMK